MALFDFVKDVGERLFGGEKQKAAAPSATGPSATGEDRGAAIAQHIRRLNLAPEDLTVAYDDAKGVATLSGTAPDQATRERIVLAAGNVDGVAQVDDRMTVAKPAAEARFYTVQKGDSLSNIAQSMYGDAGKYRTIFEANRPMLSDPDKIYPGQVLRIPMEK